jgi:wyosine [tRNA(Phe)-imidazoG37] synthetase (radical SAM superfamily)
MKPIPDFKKIISESVYGPVHSRRHGLSLGINLGPSDKVCSWSCLYCQYGFGRQLRPDEILPVIAATDVYQQIISVIANYPDLDSLTFAGNSEPGLYPELLTLVRMLKRYQVSARARWKITILSNGSELHRDDVLQAFNLADEAWLKLDCGQEATFHRLNRPMANRRGLESHLERLKLVKKLNVQTMLWGDDSKDLQGLLDCYVALKPKKIHLYTLDRDPAFSQLAPVSSDVLYRFATNVRNNELNCEVFL